MLDVRITGYIVPLAEQPQASLTPVISVENVADEDALIIGLIRIYRDSTGLMIYDSRLALTLLEHHTTANIAALTPFDPPAPADDDYFIKADLIATSHSPGPPLTVSLGAWHFDIKTPPMGEAPAGHHGTHEDGGSDEIDVTNLPGLLADCQTPCAHHGTHENGGSDEMSLADLSGLLADQQTPLAHYHDKHLGLFYETDWLEYSAGLADPWRLLNIASGTHLYGIHGISPNHPGHLTIRSSTTANSGARALIYPTQIMLGGSENTDFILYIFTTASTTIRLGFHNTSTHADARDGCYIEMAQVGGVDGVIVGKTANNSVRSTTGTNYTLAIDTWYRLRVALNSDATLVTFTLFAENGTQLWQDTLATNIPTARTTGHGIVATNSGTTQLYLVHIDYQNLAIDRVLVR